MIDGVNNQQKWESLVLKGHQLLNIKWEIKSEYDLSHIMSLHKSLNNNFIQDAYENGIKDPSDIQKFIKGDDLWKLKSEGVNLIKYEQNNNTIKIENLFQGISAFRKYERSKTNVEHKNPECSIKSDNEVTTTFKYFPVNSKNQKFHNHRSKPIKENETKIEIKLTITPQLGKSLFNAPLNIKQEDISVYEIIKRELQTPINQLEKKQRGRPVTQKDFSEETLSQHLIVLLKEFLK